MVTKINHFALTNHIMVHDEEALTTLELLSRVAAKINACIDEINTHGETIETEMGKIPGYVKDEIIDHIASGTIKEMVNNDLLASLGVDLEELNTRIDNLLINGSSTENNSELIDARAGAAGTAFPTLGDHVRKIASGEAFSDAVRPGTVKHNRIMAGMLGGELAEKTVLRSVLSMAGHWNQGNAYYGEDLERIDHTGYTVSDYFPCAYGDMFELDSYIYGNKVFPAVIFNSAKKAIGVIGEPGNGSGELNRHVVTVNHESSHYIAFVCLNASIANFRAVKLGAAAEPITEKGYVHMHAKKRTDTITDRAQIKFWIPKTGSRMQIQLTPGKYSNVAAWTFRVFACASNASYDVQMSVSAAGYKFDPAEGIIIEANSINDTTAEGAEITHLCVFVDVLPEIPENYMDLSISIPDNAENVSLHGHLDSDTLNAVPANVNGSHLYRKKIIGLGDSLMSGNTLRKEYSWFNLMAGYRDMQHINGGLNGSPIGDAGAGATASAVSRIDGLLEQMKPDYFILQGGANDKRLSVPLDTFKAAIDTIISKVRAVNPACKILLATNWNRTADKNSLGLADTDYIFAMLEKAEEYGIPCINNYAEGINLLDEVIREWADEGRVTTGTSNIHFSKEANRQIAEKYITILEGI